MARKSPHWIPYFFTSPAWMQPLNSVSVGQLWNTNSFSEVRAPAEDKNRGLLYRLTASRQTGAQGCSTTHKKPELERLSVNHPLQETHITYSLRNSDTEVSSWFEINNILFPRFKNGHSANLSFLGQGGLCSIPLRTLSFFPFFSFYLEILRAQKTLNSNI